MKVAASAEDRTELRHRVAKERDAKQRDRLRVVLLAAEGLGGVEQSRERIAGLVGRSRQFVDEWVGRYRRQGLAGLEPKVSPGRPPKLTRDEQAAFKARMLAGPTEADEGKCTLRGRDAKRILDAEFGKPLSLSSAYELMRRLNLSHLRPRPRHRKNDLAAMKAWLERAPLLSARSRQNIPANASRSGFRTKPASASRGL
jgi:transposase